ncbi:MAG: hypothetical protein R3D68_12135 [Hyphomicrobiaceae bacterium]
MSLQRLMPWLIVMLVVSVAGEMVAGAARDVRLMCIAAGTFTLAAIGVSLTINAPYWEGHRSFAALPAEIEVAARRNARLAAVAFAWGGVSMQAIYATQVTGLKWQHAWQYALVMLLFALIAFHVARALGSAAAEQRARWLRISMPLSIVNALLGAGGLVFLTSSGKLALRRADWAANLIFTFGALMIMVLAAIALKTHVRLVRS